MCYGETGTVKFLETLADNVFRHIYSMMQKKNDRWENDWVTKVYTFNIDHLFESRLPRNVDQVRSKSKAK